MPLFRPLAAVVLALCLGAPVTAQENAGAYLAARIAGSNDDFREAASWYTRALIADPANLQLMDGAIGANLNAGNFDAAVAVAQRMQSKGPTSQSAHLVLTADQARRGDFASIVADLDAGKTTGKLLDGLVRAWAELGRGQMSDALGNFDALGEESGLKAFALYHKAMALASVGDFEGADAILSDPALRLTRRGSMARAQILSQIERAPDALALLEKEFPGEADPTVQGMKATLSAGTPLPFDIVRNATDGLAETFYTLAGALSSDASPTYTLLYARVAMILRGDHPEAILLAAQLLEQLEQYDLAVETFAKIPPADGSFFAAEIGRARALERADKADAAIEVLRALARSHNGIVSVHLALGDALRRQERFAEAETAYDEALARTNAEAPDAWSIHYSRAIVLERQKKWDLAEPDFRKALALNPEQPQVLNYLGYSLLERNEKLEEALEMINRAVAQSPDSGYIVDSLAWGLFRLGRYEEAVEPMERASVLEPVDPIVTDHLGDVYWAVGRRMEARFQWRRALSFDPEEKEATRIRAKLDRGLDAVLAEEGAKPLQAAGNDN